LTTVASFTIPKNGNLAEECGIINTNFNTSGFIIGGEEAVANRYPWMAALFWDGMWRCGSALVSDEWLVTAAHCVDVSGGELSVMLGSHDLTANNEPHRKEISISQAIMHPSYNFPHNDIAVMKLSEKVEFNDNIRPICLPNKREQKEAFFGTDTIAIGWGQADNGNGVEGLRQVDLTTITEEEQVPYCDGGYPSVLCVNTQRGSVGVCFGDSGSPLNWARDNGQFVTIGAASFVIDGCQTNNPSGYSRVTENLDWISEKTGIPIED